MFAALLLFVADPVPVPVPIPVPVPLEVAPPPRLVGPPVAIAAVPNGYRITLSRAAAERLRETLSQTDEKNIAASLRQAAKEQKEGANPDESSAATLELVAYVVANQLPGFRKSLGERMGPDGVVITFAGIQTPEVNLPASRPRLRRIAGVVRGVMPLLPDDAREAVEAMRAVGRTTPLFWTIEPR